MVVFLQVIILYKYYSDTLIALLGRPANIWLTDTLSNTHLAQYICETVLCDQGHYYDEEAADCIAHTICNANQYLQVVATAMSDVICAECVDGCPDGRKHMWYFEGNVTDSASGADAELLHYALAHAHLRLEFAQGVEEGGRGLDLTAGDGYLATNAVLWAGPKTLSFYIKVNDFTEDAGCA